MASKVSPTCCYAASQDQTKPSQNDRMPWWKHMNLNRLPRYVAHIVAFIRAALRRHMLTL
eukprot:2364336-Amphidinium_carterae.1